MNSEFVVSSSGRDSWPESELPEVVVVGRSNVGKSSFINAFTGKKRLAYVGNTPATGCWWMSRVTAMRK